VFEWYFSPWGGAPWEWNSARCGSSFRWRRSSWKSASRFHFGFTTCVATWHSLGQHGMSVYPANKCMSFSILQPLGWLLSKLFPMALWPVNSDLFVLVMLTLGSVAHLWAVIVLISPSVNVTTLLEVFPFGFDSYVDRSVFSLSADKPRGTCPSCSANK